MLSQLLGQIRLPRSGSANNRDDFARFRNTAILADLPSKNNDQLNLVYLTYLTFLGFFFSLRWELLPLAINYFNCR